MTARSDTLTGDLRSWEEIQEEFAGGGLLVGNGASRAVWDGFDYGSLYEKALSPDLDRCLSETDQAIFEALETTNFETVLSALRTTALVGRALGKRISTVTERYESIKASLIEAVRNVHIPPDDVPTSTLISIRSELRKYRYVYSTNYDLLLYWAIMSKDKGYGFKDYFWYGGFDITNVDAPESATRVLYLHGGLHLVRKVSGRVAKLKSEPERAILDQFGTGEDLGAVPLFVSEGDSADKERAIRSSDYLTFALQRFAAHTRPLVVFGHSLGNSDAHLVRAMQRWGNTPIAISIRPSTTHKQKEHKAGFIEKLSKADLRFFDASTHPMGAEFLKVTLDGE